MILREEKLKKKEREKKKSVDMRKTERGELLRKVIVNIGLERMNIHKRITVEALLDSRATGLVIRISLEFARKQRFKLKKIEKSIYVRDVDGMFNKKRLIEHTIEINIFIKDIGVKIEEYGLSFSSFSFSFYFPFNLFFHFSIFRTPGLGLEVISHISHI